MKIRMTWKGAYLSALVLMLCLIVSVLVWAWQSGVYVTRLGVYYTWHINRQQDGSFSCSLPEGTDINRSELKNLTADAFGRVLNQFEEKAEYAAMIVFTHHVEDDLAGYIRIKYEFQSVNVRVLEFRLSEWATGAEVHELEQSYLYSHAMIENMHQRIEQELEHVLGQRYGARVRSSGMGMSSGGNPGDGGLKRYK